MDTKSWTGKDFYQSYCEYVEDNPLYQVEYRVFRDIINDYFRYLRDEIIENGKEVRLPCRMGTLSIVKHKHKRIAIFTSNTNSKKCPNLSLLNNLHLVFKTKNFPNQSNL